MPGTATATTQVEQLIEHRLQEIEEQLRPFAEELGVSLAQLALAWCLRQPNVSSVIVGATSVRQVEENVKAAGVRIPDEIAGKIDSLFAVD